MSVSKWAAGRVGRRSKEEPAAIEKGNIARGGNVEGGRGAPNAGGGPTSDDYERGKRREGWARDAADAGDHAGAASTFRDAAESYDRAGRKDAADRMRAEAEKHDKARGGGGEQPRDDRGRFEAK